MRTVCDMESNPFWKRDTCFVQIQAPERRAIFRSDRLELMGRVQIFHRGVFLGGNEPSPKKTSSTSLARIREESEHRCFYRAPDHSAAQQKGIDLAYIFRHARNQDADDAVISKPVFHSHRIHAAVRRGDKLRDLLLAIAPRRDV